MMTRLMMAALVLGGIAAGRGDAAFITIDNPNVVVTRPLAGSITVTLTGSISFDVGYTNLTSNGTYFPSNATGQSLPPNFYATPTAALNGGTFTGTLLTFTINSNTAVGVYNISPSSPSGLSQFTTSASRFVGSSDSQTLAANYSITVGPLPATVPEPASAALLAAGLLAAGLIGLRRSRRPAEWEIRPR